MSSISNEAKATLSPRRKDLVMKLQEVLSAKTNNKHTNISSNGRTASDQARAMLDNYKREPQAQRELYGFPATLVLDEFERTKNWPEQNIIANAAKLIERLTQEGSIISRHLTSYQVPNKMLVIDINYDSISFFNKLFNFLNAEGIFFLDEPFNRAVHIEISEQQTLTLYKKHIPAKKVLPEPESRRIALETLNTATNQLSSLNKLKNLVGTIKTDDIKKEKTQFLVNLYQNIKSNKIEQTTQPIKSKKLMRL